MAKDVCPPHNPIHVIIVSIEKVFLVQKLVIQGLYLTHSGNRQVFWLGNLPFKLRPPECSTGELGYDGLNGTRKIGPSYAKSVAYILRILDMHRTGTKHIVCHMQKSVVQWSVISKFTCSDRSILLLSILWILDRLSLLMCPIRHTFL